jgi:hypothetical protein
MINLNQLHSNILQLNESEIINLIAENKKELKLLFINLNIENDTTELLGQILVHIAALELTYEGKKSEEIQFLFTELAFYFKQNNNYGFVVNCFGNINDSILKNRLAAWIHYKLYANINSHLTQLKFYLQKLSSAISDGEEDYENDVLRDLNDYYNYATTLFSSRNEPILLEQFIHQFENEELQNEFPILKYYSQSKFQFEGDIKINAINDRIYQPSAFAENLFNEKFWNYIRHHNKTNWHEILLGYDGYTIRSQIINFGQTNFDIGYNDLKPSDIVKLYSYFNMRKHYYSSLSLLERFEPLTNLYNSNGIIKFIDIGCGPATSGIALIDYLNSISEAPISFDYFGVDYYHSMREEAKYFMDNSLYKPTLHEEYFKSLSEFDFDWLNNANSIFINVCYLFASDSLNEIELAESIQNIKKAKPEVPFYLLFQNTTNPLKNQKYYKFKKLFPNFEILLTENSTIRYNNKRNSLNSSGQETVFFEILKIN